mmetsp:Transcript_24466/g.85068  ORF Transcript_24466/g.85068 Transcript_24466/m.85068 type:complete len:278 (-) Transcript_24466:142-975(-)
MGHDQQHRGLDVLRRVDALVLAAVCAQLLEKERRGHEPGLPVPEHGGLHRVLHLQRRVLLVAVHPERLQAHARRQAQPGAPPRRALRAARRVRDRLHHRSVLHLRPWRPEAVVADEDGDGGHRGAAHRVRVVRVGRRRQPQASRLFQLAVAAVLLVWGQGLRHLHQVLPAGVPELQEAEHGGVEHLERVARLHGRHAVDCAAGHGRHRHRQLCGHHWRPRQVRPGLHLAHLRHHLHDPTLLLVPTQPRRPSAAPPAVRRIRRVCEPRGAAATIRRRR